MTDRVSVQAVNPAHSEGLAEFFAASWGSRGTARDVDEAIQRSADVNPAEPGRPLPTYVAIKGARVIGYCSTIGMKLWNGEVEVPAYWAKGLWVLPEFRNGPIGFHVLRALSLSEPLLGAVTVNPSSKRLFAALGYSDFGALPNRIRPLSLAGIMAGLDPLALETAGLPRAASSVLRTLQRIHVAGMLGRLADIPLRAAMPRTPRRFELDTNASLSCDEIDELWADVRSELVGATVRDGEAVLSRYQTDSHTSDYRLVAVYASGRKPVAIAVLRRPRETGDARLGGIRVCSFSDLLVRPSDSHAITAILSGVESAARELASDAILCSISHSSLRSPLSRRGYFSVAGNVHFFLKDAAARHPWPASLDQWWLTRGDGESDASF